MKKFVVLLFLIILISGCSLRHPGYITHKPNTETLTTYKSTLSDVVATLGDPAIRKMSAGERIAYIYYYNMPNAVVDTNLMVKGDYASGCKDCGQIVATFKFGNDNEFKDFLLTGFSVSDQEINSDIYTAFKLYRDKRFSEAYPILLKRAEGHSSAGQYYLGLMYINGQGVVRDYKKAFYWFAKSAGANNPFALHILGTIYRTGDGVPVDIGAATYFYTKAANLGHQKAMIELVKIYTEIKDQKQVDFWTKNIEAITNNQQSPAGSAPK